MHCVCAILSFVTCSVLQYISTSSVNDMIFEKKKVIGYEKCVLIFCTNFSETCFILRRNERDIIQNVYWSSCKVHVFLVPPQLNLKFLNRLSKNTQISNVKEIRPFGAELFHADGRKGTELRVAFRHITNASTTLGEPDAWSLCPDIAPN